MIGQNLLTPRETRRFVDLRRRLGRLHSANYDISNVCNLTCEGCLYFARERGAAAPGDGRLEDWQRLFDHERDRGINFVYMAGAEPSMTPDRIQAAWERIPTGVVFTNGTRRIDPAIGYRLHISLWGVGDTSSTLRGADVNAKAFRHYRGDPRAVFVFTINAQNIDEIALVTRDCADQGVVLTFSFYSPTDAYNTFIETHQAGSPDYFQFGEADLRHTPASLAAARLAIAAAMADHPDTVRYSLHYNDWISRPIDELFQFDDRDVAIDCANRRYRHHTSDARVDTGKCCSPNIDCRACRAYAMGYGNYLARHQDFSKSREDLLGWLGSLELWASLFMPLAAVTSRPPEKQKAAAV